MASNNLKKPVWTKQNDNLTSALSIRGMQPPFHINITTQITNIQQFNHSWWKAKLDKFFNKLSYTTLSNALLMSKNARLTVDEPAVMERRVYIA